MPNPIFFSWQHDRARRTGRDLIEQALERATHRISVDAAVEPAIRDVVVDLDTKGVSGTPPIVDTIFRKIDEAAVFVPDLTFVGTRIDGRPTPNPNVLIEYGWALNSLKHFRIVPVMDAAHGKPTAEAMPFDMRHLRNPTKYDCPDHADEKARAKALDLLVDEIETQIRLVLTSEVFKSGRLPEYAEMPSAPDCPGRFVSASEPIGIESDFRGHRVIHLAPGPVCWFRLMPSGLFGRTFAIADLESAMKQPPLLPLNRQAQGLLLLKHIYGLSDEGVHRGFVKIRLEGLSHEENALALVRLPN
jgi:hypothetical protein